MHRTATVLALLLAGCFFKPSPPSQAGGDAGSGGGDGGGTPDTPPCTFSPWGGLHIITSSMSTAYIEYDAALSPDGKWLVFTREPSAGGASTLWMMTVNGTTFGTPVDLGFGPNAVQPTWAPSGDLMYMSLNDARVTVTFDKSNGTFGTMAPVHEFDVLGAQRPEGRFAVTADGHHLFYEVSVNNITRLFHANGTLGDTWTTTGELTALDGEGNDQATPAISANGTEIFFATSHGSNAELATASRASVNDTFNPPSLLTFSEGERPTVANAGTMMVFNAPDFDLYYATRTCQ